MSSASHGSKALVIGFYDILKLVNDFPGACSNLIDVSQVENGELTT